eukprot:6460551-Amphidinium_carterae.2
MQYERQPQLYGALPLQYRQGTAVASTKSPPCRSPEQAHQKDFPYTLPEWRKDVLRWQAATEVDPSRHGPLLSLALGGAARTLGDRIPTELLVQGGLADLRDGQGAVHHTGFELLYHALYKRFAPCAEADVIRSALELLSFGPRETMEGLLLRYSHLLDRAEQTAQLSISYQFRS